MIPTSCLKERLMQLAGRISELHELMSDPSFQASLQLLDNGAAQSVDELSVAHQL